jgi:hypothetical protein
VRDRLNFLNIRDLKALYASVRPELVEGRVAHAVLRGTHFDKLSANGTAIRHPEVQDLLNPRPTPYIAPHERT